MDLPGRPPRAIGCRAEDKSLPRAPTTEGRSGLARAPGNRQALREALGSQPGSERFIEWTRPSPARRTILAFVLAMPRDEIQGLAFLLGLLLAFYFLMPFLELTTFR